MAHASRRCAYFATLKRIAAPFEGSGPLPHARRFIIGADSVGNRGTAFFRAVCRLNAFLRRSVSQVAEFASKPSRGLGWFYARKQHAIVATNTVVGRCLSQELAVWLRRKSASRLRPARLNLPVFRLRRESPLRSLQSSPPKHLPFRRMRKSSASFSSGSISRASLTSLSPPGANSPRR